MKEYLNLASNAVHEAAKIIRPYFGRAKIESSFAKDIKLKSDLESEKLILNILSAGSDFEIITEESGVYSKVSENKFKWIVDPLDGSLNFYRGIPHCCISIALWEDDEPVLGVIYDLNSDALFTGVVGEMACRNEKKINVSNEIHKKDSIICTGFPVYTSFETDSLKSFINQIQEYKKVRLFGSAAMSLAYLSSGVVDAYTETNIALWDVAAGIAIVKAAGGHCFWEYTNKNKFLLNLSAYNNKRLI